MTGNFVTADDFRRAEHGWREPFRIAGSGSGTPVHQGPQSMHSLLESVAKAVNCKDTDLTPLPFHYVPDTREQKPPMLLRSCNAHVVFC